MFGAVSACWWPILWRCNSLLLRPECTLTILECNSQRYRPLVGCTTQIAMFQDKRMTKAPFWFSTTVLVLLLLLIFLSCALSLIAVHRVIASRNGLALSISSNPYSWTYGPTANLIVNLSLWRRLDYYSNLREPWRELLAGPCPAKKSILLDYIPPFQIVSLIQSIKNRHYTVAAAITGFFLLKLIILGYTALFVVENIEIETTVNAAFTDTFDATDAWLNYHSLQDYRKFRPPSDDLVYTGVWTAPHGHIWGS